MKTRYENKSNKPSLLNILFGVRYYEVELVSIILLSLAVVAFSVISVLLCVCGVFVFCVRVLCFLLFAL